MASREQTGSRVQRITVLLDDLDETRALAPDAVTVDRPGDLLPQALAEDEDAAAPRTVAAWLDREGKLHYRDATGRGRALRAVFRPLFDREPDELMLVLTDRAPAWNADGRVSLSIASRSGNVWHDVRPERRRRPAAEPKQSVRPERSRRQAAESKDAAGPRRGPPVRRSSGR